MALPYVGLLHSMTGIININCDRIWHQIALLSGGFAALPDVQSIPCWSRSSTGLIKNGRESSELAAESRCVPQYIWLSVCVWPCMLEDEWLWLWCTLQRMEEGGLCKNTEGKSVCGIARIEALNCFWSCCALLWLWFQTEDYCWSLTCPLRLFRCPEWVSLTSVQKFSHIHTLYSTVQQAAELTSTSRLTTNKHSPHPSVLF